MSSDSDSAVERSLDPRSRTVSIPQNTGTLGIRRAKPPLDMKEQARRSKRRSGAALPSQRTLASAIRCPMNGDLHGRKSGFPNWPSENPKAMGTALYFDPVNFASRIKAPVMAGIGFIDTVSPPAGIWTALNQIPGPTEPLPLIESEHDNFTPDKGRACPARTQQILDRLRTGAQYRPTVLK
jgi:Acetyl xylan esterase (AXE1)